VSDPEYDLQHAPKVCGFYVVCFRVLQLLSNRFTHNMTFDPLAIDFDASTSFGFKIEHSFT